MGMKKNLVILILISNSNYAQSELDINKSHQELNKFSDTSSPSTFKVILKKGARILKKPEPISEEIRLINKYVRADYVKSFNHYYKVCIDSDLAQDSIVGSVQLIPFFILRR